jgi:biotin synthase
MDLNALLDTLASKGIDRETPDRAECLAVLRSDDDDLLKVVEAAARVRRHYFGNRVKLNLIINMKSGLCPEDCSYCSQRRGSAADILKYNWISDEDAVSAADRAVAGGAKRVCLVASGRGPTERDIDRIRATVAAIKSHHPHVEICTSLGLLGESQADQLREGGVYAYNHNLNTPRSRYDDICTTHTYDDRVSTVGRAARSGLSPCSGAIFGMGESDDEIVDLALDLRQLNPDSVPVNFLIPFEGTPLGGEWQLTPQRCLRILALFRLVFPDVEVRVAGGREIHLRSLQPLALHLANSIFLGDYLSSEGQAGSADLQMIADGGFVVEGHEGDALPNERRDLVVLRRRGPGTHVPVNA